MSTSSMIKASGLNVFQNFLSAVPEGSLFEAENVIIDRDGIIEPRRGIKVYGDLPDTAKQLISYKDRILAHYGDALAFSDGADPSDFTSYKKRSDFVPADVSTTDNTITINISGLSEDDEIVFATTATLPAPLVAGTTYFVANPTQNTFQVTATTGGAVIDLTTTGSGIHTATYDYVIASPDVIARIKGIEMNGNLYVTSATGIKKISGLNQFYISEAGGIKALDITLNLDFTTTTGFLEANKEVSYRTTWVLLDINNNLVEGVPSYKSTIFNPSNDSRNVDVSFPVPAGITTDYSYRIYRTAQADSGGSGDEAKLVYESKILATEILAGVVTVTDIQPEELQDNGLPLYTNEFSGEGISQANDKPPIAKDIAVYKNTAFYANTTTNYKFLFDLLGQDGLGAFTISSIASDGGFAKITLGTSDHGVEVGDDVVLKGTTNMDAIGEVTLVAGADITTDIVFATVGSAVKTLFTSYLTITKGSVSNKYYFVGRREIHTLLVTSNADVVGAGKYFTINSYDDIRPYYVWLNNTSTPNTDPAVANRIGIKVDYVSGDTAAQIATKVCDTLNDVADFECSVNSATITIATSNSGFATNPNISTFTGTFTLVQNGFGQDLTNNFVRLSSYSSPSVRIEDTSKSLVYVINQNEDDVVYAYYISQPTDLPGSMALEAKIIDNTAFTIVANNATTGAMFNDNLTTAQSALNESFPNRLYFSKSSQPEAVPLVNNFDIGPKDKAIIRILGLRDSLFILKEEGIYRLTGDDSSNFSVALFDNSTNITAPDTATILNNQIYCLTSQGVATISESGVGIVSRSIENILSTAGSPTYTNFASASFAFGYESDRAYILFTVFKNDDTYATRAYRYNTFTRCWTSWKKSATCGIVEFSGNKLYLGAADIDAVEVERKAISSRDYADREYTRDLIIYNDGFVLDSVADVEIGDVLEQTQYLTYSTYNRLIRKLKMDPFLLLDAVFPEITESGTDLRQTLEDIVLELNDLDTSLFDSIFDATSVGSNKITVTGHELVNTDVVILTGAALPSPLLENVQYFVVNAAVNDFQLSATEGGSVIALTPGTGSGHVYEVYQFSTTNDFETIQDVFNYNITKLNESVGAFFVDYQSSIGTVALNSPVQSIDKPLDKATLLAVPIFFIGPLTHYKAIKTKVVWAPIALGDPSLLKHIRSGTFLLENDVLIGAEVAYASDMSGNFENIGISINQDGEWGEGTWGSFTWGGMGTSTPIRVLIPRQKQRCRYIKARFQHHTALNRFAVMGVSYTFEMGSDRAYR